MFRLVLTDNPLVSPFPSHRWLTKEDAERFSNDPDGAREFAGKLTVVEEKRCGAEADGVCVMAPCEIRGNAIICSRGSRRAPKCAFCSKVSTKLCDYPLDRNHTCDMPMCNDHAKSQGNNLDTCPNHPTMRYF